MIAIASIAFDHPWAIAEQARLFATNLADDHQLIVFDNSSSEAAAEEINAICRERHNSYVRVPKVGEERLHPTALNYAKQWLDDSVPNASHIGFVDHDVMPRRPACLVMLIEKSGFLGISQRHPSSLVRYLWPGWTWFSRNWLGGRLVDFDGIRGAEKRDDGDCGSMLWPLFADEDWDAMAKMEHGYLPIRAEDGTGLQSYAVEFFGESGEWLHLTNLSRWLAVPDPEGRERLVRELVASL